MLLSLLTAVAPVFARLRKPFSRTKPAARSAASTGSILLPAIEIVGRMSLARSRHAKMLRRSLTCSRKMRPRKMLMQPSAKRNHELTSANVST
jgi:hypothetical protein